MLLCLAVVLVVAGCGGRLGLSEYAGRVEALVVELDATIVALDAEREARGPNVAGEIAYWEARAAARRQFAEGLDALDPPEALEEMHTVAVEIMERYADAEDAVVASAGELVDVAGIDDLWGSAVMDAWRQVDEESRVLCLAAQARFDESRERAELDGVPWVPREMKEAVGVAFGCTPEPLDG